MHLTLTLALPKTSKNPKHNWYRGYINSNLDFVKRPAGHALTGLCQNHGWYMFVLGQVGLNQAHAGLNQVQVGLAKRFLLKNSVHFS